MTNELSTKFNPTEVEAGRYENGWLRVFLSRVLMAQRQNHTLIASLFRHQM